MWWEETSSEHSFLRGALDHALGYESISLFRFPASFRAVAGTSSEML
jgi:hypothetical protein